MAAPERWAARALRFADLYVDPAHGNYDPRAPHHPAPAQRQRPAAGRAVRRRGLPLAAAGSARCTASRWTGYCRPGPMRPEPGHDPRLGEEMRRRMGVGRHRGQPGRGRAGPQRPDAFRRPALPGLDRRVRRRVAGAGRRQRRRHPRQRRPGRHRRRTAGRPLVRRALRLVLAARLVQRRARCHGRRSFRSRRHRRRLLSRPGAPRTRRDHRPGQGHGLHRGGLQPPVQVDRAAGRGCAHSHPARAFPVPGQRLVRLQPDPDGGAHRAVAPLRVACRPGASRAVARGQRLRLGYRAGVPQQGGSRARGALVRLPRRGQSRLPRADPRRGPGSGASPAGPHGAATAGGRSPRPTSTCGSCRTRWSPRPWSS